MSVPTRLATGFAVWLTAFAATAEAQSRDPSQPLTLEVAIAYAREHSPLIRARRHSVSTGEARVVEAQSGHLPRLGVGASYRMSTADTVTAMGLPLAPLADVPTQSPSWQHLNGNVSAEVPLYLGGRIVAQTEVARAELEVAEIGVRDVDRNLTFDVTRTYARLVELDRDVEAAQVSLDALSESRRVMAEKLAADRVARVDLLKVDTRLAGVQATLVSLATARLVEAGRMNVLLGRAVDASVAVANALPPRRVTLPLEQVTANLSQNTAIQLAQARLRTAEHGVTLARGGLLPSLSLVGNSFMQSSDPASGSDYKFGAVGGLVVTVPLFDLALVYRLKEAHSLESERDAELDQARLEAQERARTARLQVDDAEERMRATEAAIASAEEVLRIEQDKQRLGRDTVENLLDAQAALLATEVTYYRALSDQTTAVAALERETGIATSEPGK
jgi:outer membrane protein TolC